MTFRSRPAAVVVLALIAAGFVPVAVADAGPDGSVVILTDPTLAAVGLPATLDVAWLAGQLPNATVVTADDLDSLDLGPGDVIVNAHGEAFPDDAEVDEALDDGVGWVNLAGVPFFRPDGRPDDLRPATRGVHGLRVDSTVVTGTRPD